jgi:hypothetical protein
MKVRITKLPQARTGYQVQGSLANDVPAMGGADYNTYIGQPKLKASRYITAVPREEANLEAEGGETVYGDINGDGMPEHKIIKGPRHSGGGVPLSLPDDTFVYSDFRGMNMKDPNILNKFGKGSTGKKSYTPAELAKQYDIEKYRKLLEDPNSDAIDRKTAELMIKNYTQKLGALALAQEAKKGFPQGIPAAAKPYMEVNGIKEDALISPDIKQLHSQIEGQLQRAQQTRGDETDMAEYQENEAAEGQQPSFEEAQELNQGQPVAEPMAQYGMTMGGFDVPYTDVETGDFLKQAQYGMPMGINSGNYVGRPHTPRYARGGGLNQYQGDKGASTVSPTGGSEPITLDATGKTDAELNKMIRMQKRTNPDAQFNITRDGKKLRTKARAQITPEEQAKGITPEQLKGLGIEKDTQANRIAAAQVAILEKEYKDPKSPVRQKYLEEYNNTLKDQNAFGTRSGKDLMKKFNNEPLTDEQKVDALITMNKRNIMLSANGANARMFVNNGSKLDTAEELVKNKTINPDNGQPFDLASAKKKLDEYKAKGWTNRDVMIKDVGAPAIPLGPNGKPDTFKVAQEQASTHAYRRVSENAASGKYKDDADVEDKILTFTGSGKNEMNTGRADEKDIYGNGKGAAISPIDAVAGNTTLEQKHASISPEDQYEEVPEEVKEEVAAEKKCPCQKSDGTETDTGTDPNTGECNECTEDINVDVEQPAETWLQDTIKTTGAFGDLMGAKKYMPWAAPVDLQTPKPAFLDPTRELAANAEQANIQTAGMAQFAGPQGLSARSSSIQGQGAKGAADILSKYNNANVNIANQFSTNVANINNQEAMANQGIKSRLYDQNTMANQQYDNSKMALRNNLRNQYTNSITNKWKTDAMNQMFPQYATSAGVGGRMHFTEGKDYKPEQAASMRQKMDDYIKTYKMDPEKAHTAAYKDMYGDNSKEDAKVNPNGYPGAPKGQSGGFIYGNQAYPFIY